MTEVTISAQYTLVPPVLQTSVDDAFGADGAAKENGPAGERTKPGGIKTYGSVKALRRGVGSKHSNPGPAARCSVRFVLLGSIELIIPRST